MSINGGNSLNKNTTIDGVPVGEEGGDGTTMSLRTSTRSAK